MSRISLGATDDFLHSTLQENQIKRDEPLKNHTTFKIGGNADFLVLPDTSEQLGELLKGLSSRGVPFLIIGGGSNLLISDNGFRGAVIKTSCMDRIEVRAEDEAILAECGAPLSRIAQAALRSELTGMEFAAGIPGSLGGAVYMNAGAYGGEMSGITEKTFYLDEKFEPQELTRHEFGYRRSVFTDSGMSVTGSILRLKKGKASEIKAQMDELSALRREKQPLSLPSAGSVFKRPEGHFAGSLIEQAGLKGFSIGGAQVSEKHAGFILNTGGATSEDVKKLIAHIQEKVLSQFSVMLETEIKFID